MPPCASKLCNVIFALAVKFLRVTILCLIGICVVFSVRAQKPFPQNLFRSPLDIPLYLAGNFGELRSNHFHTGIDIKTEGRTGLDVHSAAAGHVSRIKISPWGYGHALYVEHPNGYTTVYGHLSEFDGAIATYAHQKQMEAHSFAIDVEVPPGALPVKEGQVIAQSGNTGSTAGPHLHFEIRETKSYQAVNPLLFGFPVKDNLPPVLRQIRVYPLTDSSAVSEKHQPENFELTGENGHYHVRNNEPIRVYGKIGIALDAVDKINNTHNIFGLHTLSLEVDGKPVMAEHIDSVDFKTIRYVNAEKDYEMYVRHYDHFHRSYLLPNNKLSIYNHPTGSDGSLTLKDGQLHQAKYVATDAYGNKSELTFELQAGKNGASLPPPPSPPENSKFVQWDEDTRIDLGDFKAYIPAGSLYDNVWLKTDSSSSGCSHCIGKVYELGSPYIPLQNNIDLKLEIPEKWRSRARQLLVVRFTARHHVWSEGGSVHQKFLKTRTENLGSFSLMCDSLPPLLRFLGQTRGSNSELRFHARDDLSGLAHYDIYIDGKWNVLGYLPKKSMLYTELKYLHLSAGSHTWKVIIEDASGNKTEREGNFIIP